MSYQNHLLVKPYQSGAATNPYRIVKAVTDDRHVVHAAAATDGLKGVTNELPTTAAEQSVDVVLLGIAQVELGVGGATREAPITADSVGRGVVATPAAIVSAIVDGGSAGAITITGIAAIDTLLSVHRLDVAADTGTSATGNKIQAAIDLTSEFSISAADAISNTGGTDTTGDRLIVTYRKALKSVIGYAQMAGAQGDIIPILIDRTKI